MSSMYESSALKALAALFQHARSSDGHNLPWLLPLHRSPLLSDFAPSSALSTAASPPPPPRSFLSSLLPRDVLSGRAFNLKGLYSITWANVTLSARSSTFFYDEKHIGEAKSSYFYDEKQIGKETSFGGISPSRGSRIQRGWTDILIASNVLAYGLQTATQGKFTAWGSQINTRIAQGQYYRLVTSAFLHANIPHLLINCYALHHFGPSMETLSGPGRFLEVYFSSAVASSALSYRFTKGTSVGASGAISGLVGAYAVYLLRHRDILQDASTKGLENIGLIIALNMLIGFTFKGIDNWGHLGGFLGGAAVSWVIGPAFKLETSPIDGRRVPIDRPPISYILGFGSRDR